MLLEGHDLESCEDWESDPEGITITTMTGVNPARGMAPAIKEDDEVDVE